MVDAVQVTGRKKLIIAGLYTETCVAMLALQAAGEGFDVYVVTDASDGVSAEAHDMAVRRTVQAGITPVTWQVVLAEWQRDWARSESAAATGEAVAPHGGASSAAPAWALQLLATPAPDAGA